MSAATESIRIQKYIADAGVCSRRAAETLIREGEVWVNGDCATIGRRITPGVDKVTVSGKPLRAAAPQRITLAMHKPRGLICSNFDPHDPDTIFTVLPREFAKHRFFCAGRLDKDSEGLVILTTDGDLAHRLMHPGNIVVKHYLVSLRQPFPAAKKNLLVKGIVYEGERLKVEHARLLAPNAAGDSAQLDVRMHHGKKREIRLLFSTLGFDVKRLKRYQIGAFSLKGIPVRAVRPLTPREVAKLFQVPRPPAQKAKNQG
jgi:23S rRNA pseudouridine2605 synthase